MRTLRHPPLLAMSAALLCSGLSQVSMAAGRAVHTNDTTSGILQLQSTYYDGDYVGRRGNAVEVYDSSVVPLTASAAQSVFDKINSLLVTELTPIANASAASIAAATGATVTVTNLSASTQGPLNITIGAAGGSGQNAFVLTGITSTIDMTMAFEEVFTPPVGNPVTTDGTCTERYTVLNTSQITGNYNASLGQLSATVATVVDATDIYCAGDIANLPDSFYSFTVQVPQAVIDALNQTVTINWNVPAGRSGSFLGLSETLQTGTYSQTIHAIRGLTPSHVAEMINRGGLIATLNPLLPDLSGQLGPLGGVDVSEGNVSITLPRYGISYLMNENQSYATVVQ